MRQQQVGVVDRHADFDDDDSVDFEYRVEEHPPREYSPEPEEETSLEQVQN